MGLPRFGKLSFGNSRIKYIVLGSVSLSAAVVSVGIFFAIYDVATSTFEYPEAGAEYNLSEGTLGQKLPPYPDGTESMTLKLNIPDGARYEKVVFDNLNLGGKALDDIISIERAATTSTDAWIYIGTMTLDGVEAKKLNMDSSYVNDLSYSARADGSTVDITLDQTVPDYTITGLRGAGIFEAADTTIDRIVIAMASGTADIGDLVFRDISSGGCGTSDCSIDIDHVKIGKLVLGVNQNLVVGSGDGINNNDFAINSTVYVKTASGSISDQPIDVR